MDILFLFLALASLVLLTWGLIAPRQLRSTRKKAGLMFGGLFLLFVILMAATAPPTADTAARSTPSPSPSSTPVVAAKATPKATSRATPTSTPSLPVLTGFGATQATWDKYHTENSHFDYDTAYDPESGLGGGATNKYGGMMWFDGDRAVDYDIYLPDGTSIASAEATAMAEFPSDARTLWQQTYTGNTGDSCYQVEVRSATLAKVLGSSDIDGDAFIEFLSLSGSSDIYSSSKVNTVTLTAIGDNPTASSAPGC